MSIIITLCLLLLLAYIFDLSSSKTKIPSVILLLILGWGVKQGINIFHIPVPDLNSALPILGTIGLVLIVLEGSLELELRKSKTVIILKSTAIAFIPIIVLSLLLMYVFYYFLNVPFKIGLLNSIPLAIISSAIAIPSSRNLSTHNKEFITYESSLSDIFGVILFNFVAFNTDFGLHTFITFSLQIVAMLLLSFVSTLVLALLLSKIKHHVKFTPIILLIILIYSLSKIIHLPSLIFIVLFGILIGNLDKLEQFKIIRVLKPQILNKEVQKFKELTSEMTFLIRTLFFLLFGFLLETKDLLNTKTLIWSISITIGIFIIRGLLIKLFKLPFTPLFYIAPRGLITILLFLSIPITQLVPEVDKSLIVQVIVFTSLIMMNGLMRTHSVNESDKSYVDTL